MARFLWKLLELFSWLVITLFFWLIPIFFDKEPSLWLLVIIGFVVLFVIDFIFSRTVFRDKEKKCAWCDGTKIKYKLLSGQEGPKLWNSSNKDGSKDKRVKNNNYKASYYSEFECKECSATTKFNHERSSNPSHLANVKQRTLVSKGNNDRKGTDWLFLHVD